MKHLPIVLLGMVLLVLGWSGVRPADRITWVMEVLPVAAGIGVLIYTARSFPLTPLVYVLIAVHAVILCVGGKWTYAHVPLGDWVKESLQLQRNPYDRLGHFAQGFVPAMIARELLLRRGVLARRSWLPFLVVCIALAISAGYELIEWVAAEALGQGADEFLGTQGYAWDTQADMALAGTGAVAALVLLSRFHDRQIQRFDSGTFSSRGVTLRRL